MTPMRGLAVLALCAATLPVFPAIAGEWYLVGNLGEATYQDIDKNQTGNALAGVPWAGDPPADIVVSDPALGVGGDGNIILPDPQIDKDDTDTTWRIGGGYQVNPHLAVEVAYVDAGEATVSTSGALIYGLTLHPSPPAVRETITHEATGIEVSGLGQYPLTERLQVLGRLGIIYLEQETTSRIRFDPVDPSAPGFGPVLQNGLGMDRKKSEFKPLVGVGMQYQVMEPLAIRLEWMRYLDAIDLGSSEEDIDSLSLGVRYAF